MKDLQDYINQLRHDFSLKTFSEKEVDKDPVVQFEKWFTEAVKTKVFECNAMTLCTVSKDGKPSSRIVLLRNFNEKGFVFYTNYKSKKARDMEINPCVALNFFWPEIERQVRINGIIEKQSAAESDLYFNARPYSSKLGAWASPQSEVIESRETLDNKLKQLEEKFQEKDVPRPPFWGGYLVKPYSIEFWQGRPGRLHDRILYSLNDDRSWKIERLAP